MLDCQDHHLLLNKRVKHLSVADYALVQRFVLRENAICREVFESAMTTAFAELSRKSRRFDQRVQTSSSSGYASERI